MAYLNLDLDYFNHPKVMRLVGLIGKEYVAIPIQLWCYVGKFHTASGMLEGYSKQEIESVLGWTGPSGMLVDTLVKISFIEETAKGYKIHDWSDHAGHLEAFKKRAKTAAKKRWKKYATSNAKEKITTTPNLPNRTVPTKPTKKSVSDRRECLQAFELTPEIQDWAVEELRVVIPVDVFEEFKGFWLDQPDKKLRTNWEATFKTRIRTLVTNGVLRPQSLHAVPPQAKCKGLNDKCESYAIPGSSYCADHKAKLVKIQQRQEAT